MDDVGEPPCGIEAAVTRMKGSEELMGQEEAFLKALADVAYFKPLKEGLALLTKYDGEIVLMPVP